jgi:hypothetical protein
MHPEVTPEQGDVMVIKRRAGAFSGSGLDPVPQARDIGSLVLTGIATSTVVVPRVPRRRPLSHRFGGFLHRHGTFSIIVLSWPGAGWE